MSKHTKGWLSPLLRAAAEAAQEKANTPDDGTCNFDSAVFFPGQLRTKDIQEAADEAEVRISVRQWLGARCVFLHVGHGQAARNTAMAEAAAKVLENGGLRASVYYQMD